MADAWLSYARTPKDAGWGKKAKAARLLKAPPHPREKVLKQIDLQIADLSAKKMTPKQKWYITSEDGSEVRIQVRYGSVGLPIIGDDLYAVIPKDKLKTFLTDVRKAVAAGQFDDKIAVAASKLARTKGVGRVGNG